MKHGKISLGIMLISLTALMLELILIRVFDVLFNPVSSYLIVSCAIYSFGLSGLCVYLGREKNSNQTKAYAARASCLFALFAFLILPFVNGLSVLYRSFPEDILVQTVAYVGVYICIAIPFFLAGSTLASLFLSYHKDFHRLYFWDLLGASIGCIIFIPFLPRMGPGGLLLIAAASGLWASGLFLDNDRKWATITKITGLALFIVPFLLPSNAFDFRGFDNKRGVINAQEIGAREKVVWDPVSKIEVINQINTDGENIIKHIAYDGGTQSSFIFPFSGNFEKLRKEIPASVMNHFWQRGVLASHYIQQEENKNVLIIGSAGGQETKAALLFGAKKIDAVEMVNAVVRLGKQEYADFNGGIFNNPKVSVHVGEGRAFLRRTKNKYDIIQIFSNHTSSSIAAGNGIISPVYLQTVEAYKEYFCHLTEDGILHINHHLYPRMVTTAAKAWRELGRSNEFQKHVLVFERNREKRPDTLPTLLVKMSPWTIPEVEKLESFFLAPSNETWSFSLVVDPLNPASNDNFLNADFFTGELPKILEDNIPYNIFPPTDDRPFFNFFRKNMDEVTAKEGNYYRYKTTGFINNSRTWFIPNDLKSLFFMFIVSVFIGSIIFFLPLNSKKNCQTKMSVKETGYFCLLGVGFIAFEFVFIQMFIKIIGNPLYSFSTIIFTLLLSAGLGSLASEKLMTHGRHCTKIPFLGILVFGLSLYLSFDYIFSNLLAMGLPYRIGLSSIALFPFGFFLGMPFPLGIKTVSVQSKQKVPWAWALNGFFTVFGGFLAIVSALFLGFQVTFLLAFACYCLAFVVFLSMSKQQESSIRKTLSSMSS